MAKNKPSKKSTPPNPAHELPDVETPPGVEETQADLAEGAEAVDATPDPEPAAEVQAVEAQAAEEANPEELVEAELVQVREAIAEIGNPDSKRQRLAKAHLDAVEARRLALDAADRRVAEAHTALREYNYNVAVPAEHRLTMLKNREHELQNRLEALRSGR